MSRIATQLAKPTVEIGLVVSHEVREGIRPFSWAIGIKDYGKKASERIVLDEYVIISRHSPPWYVIRHRAKRRGPYLYNEWESIAYSLV